MQRARLLINVGNLLELLGAGLAVYGVYRLAGVGFACVLAGVLAVVAAELIYDAHVWRVPLPRRPHPRRRLAEQRQRAHGWHVRQTLRFRRWRADRADARALKDLA